VEAFLGSKGPRSKGRASCRSTGARPGGHHSRAYQNNKEQLFLSPCRSPERGTTSRPSSPRRHRRPRRLPAAHNQRGDRSGRDRRPGQGRRDWLIRDVGRLSAQLIADFSRILVNGPGQLASSRIAASFTRPLLRQRRLQGRDRGAHPAERNLLYEMRDFVKYRKDFSVQIATPITACSATGHGPQQLPHLESSRRAAERTRALARRAVRPRPTGPARTTGAVGGRFLDRRHPHLPAQPGPNSRSRWVSRCS